MLDVQNRRKIVQNAKRAARRDGYGQIITACPNGTFSIYRDYPGVVIGQGERIVGRVSISWALGILQVNYREERTQCAS